jgi:hypothetical protein
VKDARYLRKVPLMRRAIVNQSLSNNVLFRILIVRGQLDDLISGTAHMMKYRIAYSKMGARALAEHDPFRRNYQLSKRIMNPTELVEDEVKCTRTSILPAHVPCCSILQPMKLKATAAAYTSCFRGCARLPTFR